MRRVGWNVMMSVVGATVVFMLALLGMATRAEAHQGDGIANAIHACVANNGNVRIVGPDGSCRPSETAVHWSITGPQGPPGPTGPQGPQGPAGVLGSFDALNGLPCTPPGGGMGSVMLLYTDAGVATLVCSGASTGRFIDLGLTVYDTQTGLQWEKKVEGGGCLHCLEGLYSWCQATGNMTGECGGNAASWIGDVNAEAFAGYTDWRVPTIAELQTILLEPFPCGVRFPCIDPIFGPTASARAYWSAEGGPTVAWGVLFGDGDVFGGPKSSGGFVRAVRGGP